MVPIKHHWATKKYHWNDRRKIQKCLLTDYCNIFFSSSPLSVSFVIKIFFRLSSSPVASIFLSFFFLILTLFGKRPRRGIQNKYNVSGRYTQTVVTIQFRGPARYLRFRRKATNSKNERNTNSTRHFLKYKWNTFIRGSVKIMHFIIFQNSSCTHNCFTTITILHGLFKSVFLRYLTVAIASVFWPSTSHDHLSSHAFRFSPRPRGIFSLLFL